MSTRRNEKSCRRKSVQPDTWMRFETIRMQMEGSTTLKSTHNTKAGFQFSYANSALSSIRWNSFSERARDAFEFASRAPRKPGRIVFPLKTESRIPRELQNTRDASVIRLHATRCISFE